MIARVPLFASMDFSEIAEITKLLYTRTFMPGVPMVRADDAVGAMFIVASCEAEVEVTPSHHVVLKEDFFGGMALLEHRRHKHDVVARRAAQSMCSTVGPWRG
jgi:signal-transduction protein with cAMP-binding, CBS, and nucleotidyltransferase domain